MSPAIAPPAIGEHVRLLRLKRHVSVRAFAAQTGFSPSFISQLENGQVSPSLGSLQRIAEALGVTLGEFFAATANGEETLIVRTVERRRLDSTWTDAHIEALGSMAVSRRLEPVLVRFGPGGKSGKHPHSQTHEEFAFVVRGRMTLRLADDDNELCAGDSVTLPAHSPHRWENHSNEVAEVLIVTSRARG
ncbi:MAG TPA: cupin domain-containing protein [Vicinamibacteria bacterium]|nr:cupin domain-containing protein [Vicinamibacteria bacterium]